MFRPIRFIIIIFLLITYSFYAQYNKEEYFQSYYQISFKFEIINKIFFKALSQSNKKFKQVSNFLNLFVNDIDATSQSKMIIKYVRYDYLKYFFNTTIYVDVKIYKEWDFEKIVDIISAFEKHKGILLKFKKQRQSITNKEKMQEFVNRINTAFDDNIKKISYMLSLFDYEIKKIEHVKIKELKIKSNDALSMKISYETAQIRNSNNSFNYVDYKKIK
jgi:hypothetical protein